MFSALRPAIVSFAALTFLTGIIYPAMVTLIANVAFADQAGGSVITRDGKTIGSSLIGQNFTDAKYFWPRPSAAGANGYDAASGSGSNLGTGNPALHAAVASRVKTQREASNDPAAMIPADLVTASGSGLDPHISPATAEYQVARVARARGMSEADVRRVVSLHTEGRTFGILGEPRVNVLRLNVALDSPKRAARRSNPTADTIVGWRGRGFAPEAR